MCRCETVVEAIRESTPPAPQSIYAVSKNAQEHLAAVWAASGGGSVRCLRYQLVYGPGMPRETPYSGVAATFRSALERGQAPVIYEDGQQVRALVHVSDVARANILALTTPGTPGLETYNIGSGTGHTILDIATHMARAVGGPSPIITGDYAIGRPRDVLVSVTAARDALGFQANLDFADGIAAFVRTPMREPAAATAR